MVVTQMTKAWFYGPAAVNPSVVSLQNCGFSLTHGTYSLYTEMLSSQLSAEAQEEIELDLGYSDFRPVLADINMSGYHNGKCQSIRNTWHIRSFFRSQSDANHIRTALSVYSDPHPGDSVVDAAHAWSFWFCFFSTVANSVDIFLLNSCSYLISLPTHINMPNRR